MKNLIFITVILLFATTSMFAQNETGYVKVRWDDTNVTGCCANEQVLVSYGVLRISDYTMVADGWTIVSPTLDNYTFSFSFPCATENEAFRVFAEVKEGCENPEMLCGQAKDEGENTTCSGLMSTFTTFVLELE